LIKGPTLVINPEMEIDTNETETNETEVNTTDPIEYECPYGNDETEYATCEFSYMHQNKFSDQTLDHVGINDRIKATSINGCHVLACSNDTVDEFINYTREQIENKFRKTFSQGGQFGKVGIKPETTTDLYIIDIEY